MNRERSLQPRMRSAPTGAALPFLIVAGAVLLTIGGLLAIKNEAAVAGVRRRERTREAVERTAEAMAVELAQFAAARSTTPATARELLLIAEEPACLSASIVTGSGKCSDPRGSPPTDEEGVREITTHLEQAAWHEFTNSDPAAASRTLDLALQISAEPAAVREIAVARAGLELRRGDGRAARAAIEAGFLLKTGGPVEISTIPTRVGYLYLMAGAAINAEDVNDLARRFLEHPMLGRSSGDATFVRELAGKVNLPAEGVQRALVRCARERARAAAFVTMTGRARELYETNSAVIRFDDILCIPGRRDADARGVYVLDMPVFLNLMMVRLAPLSGGEPVRAGTAAGELREEVAVSGTDGLLRVGVPKNYSVEAAGPGFAHLALAALVVLLGCTIGGGAFLLSRASRREIEAARAKSEFLAGVTHELKTPLASIRLYGELLEEGRITEEGKQKEYIQTIGREAERLTSLIDRVLALARLERAATGPAVEPVPSTELLVRAREAFQPVADQAKLQFTVVGEDAPVLVQADPVAAVQAILDLLDNAKKHGGPGGVIELTGARAGDRYQLTVADRGPGLPPGDPEELFVMFARGSGDSTRGKAGLGIGLAIARRILEAGGGTLTARPRSGGGAVFEISLPVSASFETPSKP